MSEVIQNPSLKQMEEALMHAQSTGNTGVCLVALPRATDPIRLVGDDEHIEFSLDANADSMAQAEKYEVYLMHHGIKGMKWGVRRSATELSGHSSIKSDPSRISMAFMKTGSVINITDKATGQTKTLIKGRSGKWGITHLSSDAENLIRANERPGHELSNKEMQDAIARARLIEDYNKFFGPPNKQKDLKQQVERLDLEKRYAEHQGRLNPSASTKVTSLIKSATGAYGAYKNLDKTSGGALSTSLAGAMHVSGLKKTPTFGGKHRALKKVANSVAEGAKKK